ncbi:MAG: hypothetical protein HQL56_18235, partial [Magnetococcales bacterium]|nr:hypothetical protein [Magnetococcales bacterium]
MTAITFDTPRVVRRLKDAGIPGSHAGAFKEARATQANEPAAKRDIMELDVIPFLFHSFINTGVRGR